MVWLIYSTMAFLFNGLVIVGQKYIGHQYGDDLTNAYLLALFSSGVAVCAAYLIFRHHRITRSELIISTISGVFVYFGNLSLVRAAGLAESHFVFPIVFGSWMLIVALISCFGFKERLNWLSCVALLFGIVAVVLLSS